MHNLGCLLGLGEGCEQNYSTAVDWFRQAASQGHVEAMVNLGVLLTDGTGVDQVDHEQANALFREAIEAGNINALYHMGYSCFYGQGVEQNTATALSYWQRAADQGNALATWEIGQAYWKGTGEYDVDFKLAKKYSKASAAQGNDYAIADFKTMTSCALCGTGSAPRVCASCKQVHYCNKECQLLHWSDPSDPHMAHCCSRRPDASSVKSPTAAKPKSDCPCAA